MYWLLEKLLFLNFLPKVFAQSGGNNLPSGGDNTRQVTISNPLGEGATIQTLISRIVDFLVLIAIPILSLMVLWAAFNMLTAGGDEKKFEVGKKTLLYAAIGFGIILIGEGLVKLIELVLTGGAV